MLELKNVSLVKSDGLMSEPFSMLVERGEVSCICAADHLVLERLLLSVLGLAPTDAGYITIDGELVTPGSSAYFRQLISYVPRDVPDSDMTVAELCDTILRLRSHRHIEASPAMIMDQWRKLDIQETYYRQKVNTVPPSVLQLILLALLPILRQPVVLVDLIHQHERIQDFLRSLANDGAEVLYVCQSNMMSCDKIINL